MFYIDFISSMKMMYICASIFSIIMDAKQLIYSRETLEFATIAKEFCAYLETCDESQPAVFVGVCHKLLPLLYYKGTLLPHPEPLCDDLNEQFVTELQYVQIEQKMARMLAPNDEFMLLCQLDGRITEDVQVASLAEHLADVYQELKNFEGRFSIGNDEIMNDALWELSETFADRWGERLARLVAEFHRLRHSGIDLEPPVKPRPTSDDL